MDVRDLLLRRRQLMMGKAEESLLPAGYTQVEGVGHYSYGNGWTRAWEFPFESPTYVKCTAAADFSKFDTQKLRGTLVSGGDYVGGKVFTNGYIGTVYAYTNTGIDAGITQGEIVDYEVMISSVVRNNWISAKGVTARNTRNTYPSSNPTIKILQDNTNSYSGGFFYGNVYGYEIWTYDDALGEPVTLRHKLIPCTHMVDGVLKYCLYDIITDTFKDYDAPQTINIE